MKHYVRDGVRTLEFSGAKLAESSSREPKKPRWVEFELYKTPKGQYVLARIGVSVYYHSEDCQTVSRNKLSAVDGAELSAAYVPCDFCKPNRLDVEGIYPETPRYSAYVCTDAVGVVASLMKRDNNNTEYLTNVARRLLTEASRLDQDIADAFYVDRIE
jgi:hypothetical protein